MKKLLISLLVLVFPLVTNATVSWSAKLKDGKNGKIIKVLKGLENDKTYVLIKEGKVKGLDGCAIMKTGNHPVKSKKIKKKNFFKRSIACRINNKLALSTTAICGISNIVSLEVNPESKTDHLVLTLSCKKS